MTLLEQIQMRLLELPSERQGEVLDFITFLQLYTVPQSRPAASRSLRRHPAFGSWRGRKVNALEYEQKLRAEWDQRP